MAKRELQRAIFVGWSELRVAPLLRIIKKNPAKPRPVIVDKSPASRIVVAGVSRASFQLTTPLAVLESVNIFLLGQQESEGRLVSELHDWAIPSNARYSVAPVSENAVAEIFLWTAKWRIARSAMLLFQGRPTASACS